MSSSELPASPPSRRKRRVGNTALVSLLSLAGLAAYLAPAVPALTRYGALPKAPEGTQTFLVAGVTPKYPVSAVWPYPAAPEDFTGLTDTIMLVQVRAGERKLKLLNVPRDTWTAVPGWGYSKINAANVRGGPPALRAAVEDLTGIRIDGHVLLSLDALRDVTSAAGGVTVNIEKPMKYTDKAGGLFVDFEPGRHHLNGKQAEAYLRFRYDGMGDIGRVERQQAFIKTLGARLLSFPGMLYAPRVVGALERNVRTDLSRQDLAQLLGALLRRPTVETTLLPGGFGSGGTWEPDRAAIRALAQTTFAREILPGDPRGLKVALINESAPGGSARRLKEKLEGLGYSNVVVGNGRGGVDHTTVFAADRRAAERLRSDLGYGSVSVASTGEAGADITVRLGADTPGQ
ncbi:LCP family protein [Deinococcus peraridilitoris]|uniref:Cell envelope-related function transcriptional attenuator common domain protein n=1 Tax=Deinococcus peraridilitoris (strain DSM 19664 / LMG 22246 / CIP 109416 / KR-200) TaxID=937777 RepID=L0A1E4_DEIPD|nr:LCP family protein [Deinococcus peraridilitoris]AFZ67274.1 cell envelope-related function transcriptional attenuator common domain protein [Deinococcus peraridilitoris DSM 19664]